jgi:hypothetical protein
MIRITISLTEDEREALRVLAFKERRDSRAQAAFIIHEVLEKCGLLPADPQAPNRDPAR